MNTAALSGVTPSAPQPASAGMSAGSADNGTDDRFSRMLEGGTETTDAHARNEAPAGSGKTQPASGKRAGADGRDAAQSRAAKVQETGATRAEEDTAARTAAAANDDASSPAPANDDTPDSAGGWPPPGLASLLAPVAVATPAPTAAASVLDGTAANPPAMANSDGSALSSSGTGLTSVLHNGAGNLPATNPSLPVAGSVVAGASPAMAAPAGDAAGVAPEALASLQPVADAGTAAAPDPSLTAFPLAAPASGTAATQTAPATPVSAPPHAPVPQLHGEAFADDIGTHVQWLAGQKIGHAHIRISPQDLGPVEIRLQLDGDRISADFSSAQPEVRQALENGLPRLREMLGQGGFQLAHAGVGQQSPQDGGGQRSSPRGSGGGDMANDPVTPAPARLVARGLLDAYA